VEARIITTRNEKPRRIQHKLHCSK